MNIAEQNKASIAELCNKHHVRELYLFGSALTEHFNKNSDVDLLVQFEEINPAEYFNNYMDLKENLEKIFRRPVDFIENQAIRNPILRKAIDRDKKLVYERKNS